MDRGFVFLSSIIVAGTMAACSGSSAPQLASSDQPMTLGMRTSALQIEATSALVSPTPIPKGPEPGKPFLYIATGTNVIVLDWPINSNTKVVDTLSGFTQATGVKVGTNNINVADYGAGQLDIYYEQGGSAFMGKCTRPYSGAYAVTLNNGSLYLADQDAGLISQFPTTDGTGTPAACTHSANSDSASISAPAGIVADANFVYVANNGSNGGTATIAAYAQPFYANEAATTIVPLPANAKVGGLAFGNASDNVIFDDSSAAVSEGESLFVTDSTNGVLYQYALPVTALSTPMNVLQLPGCGNQKAVPFGIAIYGASIYVTDQCSLNLVVFWFQPEHATHINSYPLSGSASMLYGVDENPGYDFRKPRY